MPRGPTGDYNLPPNVIVSEGQTILPSQHNPALQDIESALTNSLDRNGRGAMLAALDMGGHRAFNLPDGVAGGDAATVRQVDSRLSNQGGEVTGTVTSRLLNNILDALASHLTFKRGDGSGIHARIDSVGDGAQGLEKLLLTLVDPSVPSEKTWGINWTNGTLELPGDAVEPGDAVRKGQFDAVTGQATTAARGTVELATNAEARTGTDSVRALTPSNISALMMESSAITPTAGTTGSFAHGLGVAPVRYEAVLVNLTAQAGWSPGQEVRASDLSWGTNPQNRTGLQVGWDGTNVYWAIALDGVLILDRSTAAMTNITPANWELRIRVFAK